MTTITTGGRATELAAAGLQYSPFVAWNNLGAAAGLDGTAVLPDGDRINAVSAGTWNFWRPNVTASEAVLQFDMGAPVILTFAALAAHNLGDLGGKVVVENSVNPLFVWNIVGPIVEPAGNGPIAWRMAASGVAARQYWRFRITGLTAGDPLAVGVAFLGNELVIPTTIYQGVRPPMWPTREDGETNISVGGHLMGSDTMLRGGTLTMDLDLLPAEFVRGVPFREFVGAWNRRRAAFVSWRPTKYPEDLIYAWREGNAVEPQNTGPKSYMGLTLGMGWHAG